MCGTAFLGGDGAGGGGGGVVRGGLLCSVGLDEY